jgi:hypothetical protein
LSGRRNRIRRLDGRAKQVLEPRKEPGGAGPLRQRGRVVGSGQPSVLRVPRRVFLRDPGGGPAKPVTRAAYGTADDLEQVRQRPQGAHGVRVHTFNPQRSNFNASDEKRKAWALLDPATRIEIAGQVDFPETGTIRSLKLHVEADGTRWIEIGYQRGTRHPDDAPRPVAAQALREAMILMSRLSEPPE